MSKALSIATNNRISSTDMIINPEHLDSISRFASMMSGSSMVPAHFKGMTVDCGILITKALSLGLNPVDMAQEVFPVNGKMTFGSKLIIAMIHNSGLVEPRTFTQELGDWSTIGLYNPQAKKYSNEKGIGLRVGFKFIGDEHPTFGSPLMLEMQKIRNSPLWSTDPMQQMTYLAAKRWSSIHMPGVTMGMVAKEEADDYAQPGEKDITPEAPSMMQGEEIKFPQKEVKQEDRADIEDYQEQEKVIEPTPEPQPEPTPEPEKTGPQEGDLDALDTPFESEFMTGTKLKSDGSWRLNKAGQARKAELEAQQEEQEEQEEQEVKLFMVKAVHPEAVDMLGGEGPFEVVSFDENSGLVQLKGQDDMLPLTDGEDVYLERVTETSDESLKVKESLDAVNSQFKGAVERLHARIANIGNEELKTQAIEAVKKWEDHAKKAIGKVAMMGNKATKENVDALTEGNRSFWNESLVIIKYFEAEAEKLDTPFGE